MINYKIGFLFDKNNNREIDYIHAENITDLRISPLKEQLTKINEISEKLSLGTILVEKDKFIIPDKMKRKWLDIYFNQHEKDIYYSKEERRHMLYFLLFAKLNAASLLELQDFFHVSKNTIVNDLIEIKNHLTFSNIKIVYSRKAGYVLVGNDFLIRSVAFEWLDELYRMPNGEILLFKGLTKLNNSYYAAVRNDFEQLLKKINIKVVKSRFDSIIYFIAYLRCHAVFEQVTLSKQDKELLSSTDIYKDIESINYERCSYKNEGIEKYYLTILIFIISEVIHKEKSLDFLKKCAEDIINEFERVSASQIRDRDELLTNLYNHLVPAFFRIKYCFKLDNPLIDEIYHQYSDVFNILKVALHPFKMLTSREIPDSEIGYFTILFASQVSNIVNEDKYRALVICPNGVSSSTIMKWGLSNLFPDINFETMEYRVGSINNKNFYKNYDMIFSTFSFDTNIPIFVVKPIMTEIEKYELIERVYNAFQIRRRKILTIGYILNVIMPYVQIKNGMTQSELLGLVQHKINRNFGEGTDDRPPLSKLLNEGRIKFYDKQLEWEKAVVLCLQPLLDEKIVTEKYIDSIIARIKEYGPFIDLGYGIALPHARPEEGANKIGISMLFCEKPVYLPGEKKHPIKIFIGLSVIDSRMHLRALATLTSMLSNEKKLNKLIELKSSMEVMKLIKEFETTEITEIT